MRGERFKSGNYKDAFFVRRASETLCLILVSVSIIGLWDDDKGNYFVIMMLF